MDRQYIEQYTDSCNLHGIYRGEVIYNNDPKKRGRVKVFVYGVYSYELKRVPEQLPWAEPAMSLFGGNWTNENFKRMTEAERETLKKAGKGFDSDKDTYFGDKTFDTSKEIGLNQETGWCSIPHAGKKANVGAQVFVFFEGGDANKPVYFAAAQSGDGWISEYPNQHSIKTDNVSIIVNEDYDGLEQKIDVTDNQVSMTQIPTSNSAVFNEYANKRAQDFIPEVDLNELFGGYTSDSNGVVENDDLRNDGNNFGSFYINDEASNEDGSNNIKEAVTKSKPSSLSHNIKPEEEISFYDTTMPIVTFNWSYEVPSDLSYDDIQYFELRISDDSAFKSILKYKCKKEDRSLKINSLHAGKFYAKVRAVFTEYGYSDWSSVDNIEIKYKEDVKLKYEPQKITRPTRVNIFVENKKGVAINLRILGDVNMNIDGNVTEVITGDKYQTINGSLVQTIKKGFLQKVEGVTSIINKDEYTHHCDNKRTIRVAKDNFEIYQQNSDIDVHGGLKYNVFKTTKFKSANNIKIETRGSLDFEAGDFNIKTTSAFSVNAIGGIGFRTSTFQCSCNTNIELGALQMITVGCTTLIGTVLGLTELTTTTLDTLVTGNRFDVTMGAWIDEVVGNATLSVMGMLTSTVMGNQNISVMGVSTFSVVGASTITVGGASVFSVAGVSTFSASDHKMYPTSPHIHIGNLGQVTTPPLF